MRKPEFVVGDRSFAEALAEVGRAQKVECAADQMGRRYYQNGQPLLWVTFKGVTPQADSLLGRLRMVSRDGLRVDRAQLDRMERDVRRMRTLDFDRGDNTAAKVAARLDLMLTRAYLRYVIGQRFGWVNPLQLFNRLDALREDTATGRVFSYRGLFDVRIERPDHRFLMAALAKIAHDSVPNIMDEVEPQDRLYALLRDRLADCPPGERRQRILCNMERCRWRGAVPPWTGGQRHVVVNIPAFHLYAYSPDSVCDMRVGCGTVKTKTPLLVSGIERMDVNPVWNVPFNIIKNEVSRHAGDSAYFARNHFYIVDKSTGKRRSPHTVSAAMLQSGNFRLSQEGGEGNSLGRIIFRFANNFSVFLHDTSSRQFFDRSNRGVSHGCVRVQRPYDLALFLRPDLDEWQCDKLRISMGLEPLTDRGQRYVEGGDYNFRLVSSLPVSPHVPLYITYFTLYLLPNGEIQANPDVYGYDRVLGEAIKPFVL